MKTRPIGLLCCLAIMVLLVLGVCCVPVAPRGSYLDRYVATDGPAYLDFKDGSAFSVVCLGTAPVDGFQTNAIGSYQREHGKWVWTTVTGGKVDIVSRLLWIRIAGDKDVPAATYWRAFRF